MKRLINLFVLSTLVALMLAMVAIVPASADAPEHSKIVWEEDFTLPACGVDLQAHLEEKYEYILRFDQDGEPYGDSYHFASKLFLTYNGHTLTLRNISQERYIWIIPGEVTKIEWIGIWWWMGTVPGHGPVMGSVGRLTFSETCHWEDEELICENDYDHFSGMTFDDPEATCDYFLHGN